MPEVPATSIPPPKTPKSPNIGLPIECTQDQFWEIYMTFTEDPTGAQMREALAKKGIVASLGWVNMRIAKWDMRRKRAMALAGSAHPSEFDERKIGVYLEKLGKAFNPVETLGGVQARLLAVISNKMVTDDPETLQGFMKLYSMMTDELKRNYQKRLADGEIIETPAAKIEETNVKPFKKRS